MQQKTTKKKQRTINEKLVLRDQKINKTLARLSKSHKKRKKIQITYIKSEKDNITTDPKYTKGILWRILYK